MTIFCRLFRLFEKDDVFLFPLVVNILSSQYGPPIDEWALPRRKSAIMIIVNDLPDYSIERDQ